MAGEPVLVRNFPISPTASALLLTVLQITGGTASPGYATILYALRASYTVRNQKSVESIRAGPSVQPCSEDLGFAIVEDIVIEGAYNKTLQDIIYVLHIASPLPGPARFFSPVYSVLALCPLAKTYIFLDWGF